MGHLKSFIFVLFLAFSLPCQAQDESPLSPEKTRDLERASRELVTNARRTLSPTEVKRLSEVIAFARNPHGNMRRHGGEPALVHSLRVATAVANSSHARPTAIYAAVLHDVVEDTKVGIKPIHKKFGKAVSETVHALSIDPLEAFGGDKTARDKAYYERFGKSSRAAHIVKIFDRTDNINDMRGFSHEGKLSDLQTTRDTLINAMRNSSPDLAAKLSDEVARSDLSQEKTLNRYRRADGTLEWKRVTADKALQHGAGVAHFALALFLKEMAVVIKTGDKTRIEEFFQGLATTDFFVTYGLFSADAHIGSLAYSKYLEKYIKPRFVSGILRTNLVLATGMALRELDRGTFNGKAFAINLTGLELSSAAVKAGVSSIKDETALEIKVEELTQAYQKSRHKAFAVIYSGPKRSADYLSFSGVDWILSGAVHRSASDPYLGRDDLFARWGRASIRSDFRRTAAEISSNRLQSYDDQLNLLNRTLKIVGPDSVKGRLLLKQLTKLKEIARRDQELSQLTSVGAKGGLSEQRNK
jgi:hypothetical protein